MLELHPIVCKKVLKNVILKLVGKNQENDMYVNVSTYVKESEGNQTIGSDMWSIDTKTNKLEVVAYAEIPKEENFLPVDSSVPLNKLVLCNLDNGGYISGVFEKKDNDSDIVFNHYQEEDLEVKPLGFLVI